MLLPVLTLVLLAGCGGGDGPEPFAAKQVAARFAEVTGERLVTDAGAGESSTTVLTLDRSSLDAAALEDRFGTFTIQVVEGKGQDPLLRSLSFEDPQPGEQVRTGDGGVRWKLQPAAVPTWLAAKRYRNVVMQWQGGREPEITPQLQRIDAALASLGGAPPELPPQDQPCDRRGIDPTGTEGSGTCRLGSQTVVVGNRGDALDIGDLSVREVELETRRAVVGGAYGDRLRARGRFLVVRFRVSNHGDEPLPGLATGLRIGDRAYATSDQAELLLRRRDPFPLQPGAGADVIAAFELPAAAAERARRRGALLLAPGATGVGPSQAGTVGWLRLRPAPAE